eukprot:SAG11_NODE_12055_length_724_cov_0.904000_1_plen_72_part_10
MVCYTPQPPGPVYMAGPAKSGDIGEAEEVVVGVVARTVPVAISLSDSSHCAEAGVPVPTARLLEEEVRQLP